MKQETTKKLRVAIFATILFLSCAFTLLPQSVRAATVTATIPVGSVPWGIAVSPNGQCVYVTNQGSSVSMINTTSNTVTATIPVGGILPCGIAVSPNGQYVYVTSLEGNSVLVISAVSNTVTATISVGRAPWGIAFSPNGAYIYVTNQQDSSVSVISAISNTVTATIPVGTFPMGIAVSPNGQYVYVTNEGSNTVSVISAISNTVTATIPVGNNPWGTAVSPDSQYVYVVNYGSNSVSVIDAVSNTVTAIIPVGSVPWGIAVSPNGQYVYVTNEGNYNGNSVSVINTTSNTVTATIPVGNTPRGIAVSPNGQYVYVTNCSDNTVSVIETAIDTFAISVTQGTHGTISPGTTTVNYGSSQDFTFTPATGYHIVAVIVNGTTVATTSQYTISDVTGPTSLTAEYAINTYAITVSQGDHGTIAPSTTTINYGDSQTFTITPATGYHISYLTVDGSPVTIASSFTFSNVQATHTITASFAIDNFAITVTQNDHGTITPTTTTINYGSSQEFTITPNMGYHISSLVVDGSAVTVASTYTFSNIQDDHSITASFTTDTLTATVTTTGETYPVEISGNVTTEQFSNMTITPYQDTKTTSADFTLTGPSGTEGFCNLTLPNTAIPFGTNPVVYIDGIAAENQSFTQDSDNYYIAFTTHFSTHQMEILFTTESNPYILIPITNWAPNQTSNTSPNPTTIPTPTIPPTPTATPRPTTNPTSAPTTMLATFGQYITVAVATILLGAVIIGLMQRRKHSTKAPLK